MAPRGKRAKAAEPPSSSSLLAALKFISVAQREDGFPYQTHSILANNYAIAFDGVLASGAAIEESLNACPHTLRLSDALAKCGQSLSITQLDGNRLSLKAEKFKAIIPCVDADVLNRVQPDPPCGVIDDRLKAGLGAVACLVSDSGKTVVESAILIQANTVVSTNRHVMLEYWHGINLPPNLLVPKAFANAVIKCPKTLTKFGFSDASLTLYFEDDSWLRTQLYQEQYPNIARVLDKPCNAQPLPETFYSALQAVAPFSETNAIYFRGNFLASHAVEGAGASYEIEGLPDGLSFNANFLKMIEPSVKTIDFLGVNGVAYFFGDSVRGAICGIRG